MESFSGYVAPSTNYRRAGGFIVVIVLHLGLFYALQSGLARTLVNRLKDPFEARLIEEMKADTEEPPPPPPKLEAPKPVFIDMPDVAITEAPSTNTITATNKAPEVKAPPPVAKDIIVAPKQNPRNPISQPEYPTMSRRLGEEGSVVLLLTLDEEGRVTDAKVDTTSGFERLDEAAVKEAKRARQWKFIPGSVNGKAAPTQFKFRVVFKIEK